MIWLDIAWFVSLFLLFLFTDWKISYWTLVYAFIALTFNIFFMNIIILFIKLRLLYSLYRWFFRLFFIPVFGWLYYIGCYFNIRIRISGSLLCDRIECRVIIDFVTTSWYMIETVHTCVCLWTSLMLKLGLKLLLECIYRTGVFVSFRILFIFLLFVLCCHRRIWLARLLNMIIELYRLIIITFIILSWLWMWMWMWIWRLTFLCLF